jgi:hypothetical protein
MADHVEEREFTLRLVFRTAFSEDYEGERDGLAWTDEADAIIAAAVRAASAAIRNAPDWKVTAGNRGRPTEDEVTLEISRRLDGTAAN